MSNYLMRELRTQLVSTMDSVLKSAVVEIMVIFENSLRDHQVELAQKGEEIDQLKIKLQEAEVKQRDAECGGGRGAEVGNTEVNETQTEPEDVLNAPGQTSDVPEIDFEVPDDWCAPLCCETTKKQDEGTCPSVRLRQLYIPLWPIPVIKQEVTKHDIDQQTSVCRRSKRGYSQEKNNDMSKLLRDIKHEYTDPKSSTGHRRRGRNEQESPLKSKRKKKKITSVECESMEQEPMRNDNGKSYSCKFCEKVFDTPFGRAVHVRSHKRCRGCKKDFPFPSTLRSHEPFCLKLKKLLAKEAQSTDPPIPFSSNEETPSIPSKKQMINKEEKSAPFLITPGNKSQSPNQKDKSSKKYFCAYCNKKCRSRSQLQDHVRVHTGEKPFPCSFCPKKFRIRQLLKNHIFRMHLVEVNSALPKGDLAWTKPLEVIEDNREALISPSKDADQTTAPNSVQREGSPGMKPKERWQTMGVKCSNGFKCALCQKVLRNKYLLIGHFRTHTGERPFKCQRCSEKFRSHRQLSLHRKQGCSRMIECETCKNTFPSQKKHDKHMLKCHRDWPHTCTVCGRGFVFKGRLQNHIELCHK